MSSGGGGGGGSVGGGGSLSSSKSGRRLRKTKRGPDPSSRYHSSSSYNHHHHRGGGQPLPQQQQHQQYPLQQQQQHQHPHPERFFTVDESTAENDHSYHYGGETANKGPSHHQQQYYNNNNIEGPVGSASSNIRQQNRRVEQQHRDNDMIALPHLEPNANSAGVINGGGNNSDKISHHPRPSLQPSKSSTTSAAKEFSSGAPPANSGDRAAKRSSSTTSTTSSANNSGGSTGGAPVGGGGGGGAAASRRRQSATRLSHSSAGSNSASSLKGYSDSLGGGSGSYADAKSIGGESASLAYSLESSNTFMKQMEESLEGRFVNLSSSKNSNNSSTGSGTNRRSADAYGSAGASPARSNNNNVYSVVDEEDGDDDEDEIPLAEKEAVVMSQSPSAVQSQSSSHQDYEYVSSASSSEDEDDEALTAASSADGDMLDQISAAPSGLSMGMEDETEQHHMIIGDNDNSLHYQDSSYPIVLTSPSQEQSLHSSSPPDRSTTDSVKADVTTDFAKIGSNTNSKNDQHIFRTKTPVDSDIVPETRDGTSNITGSNNNNSQQHHDGTASENINATERLPNESLREFWTRRERDAQQQKDDYNQQSRSVDNVEAQRAQDKIKKYKESFQPDIHPLPPEQQGSFGSSSTASPKSSKKQTSKNDAARTNEEHDSSARSSAAVSFNDPISNDSSSSRDPITNGSAAAAGSAKSTKAAFKASDTSLSTALSEGGQLERISSEDSDYKSPTSLLNLLGDDDSDEDDNGDGGEAAAAMEKKRASKKGGDKKDKKPTKDGANSAELDTTHRIDNRSKEESIVAVIDPDADDRQESRNIGESNTGTSAEDIIAGAKEAGATSTKSQVETAHESAAVGQAQAHGQTQTEKETQKSSSTGWSSNRSVPNLHRDLAICSWSRLDRHLVKLSKHPKVLLQALTQQNPDLGNATPLHTACWKAPPPLALHMISLLTRIYKHMERVCLATDLDGNTPLHLSAANSCHIDPEHNHHHNDYDVYSGKDEIYGANGGGGGTNGNTDAKSIPGFKEADVIEALVLSSPKALKIQNQEGDTPLHLAVSSSSSMERVVACLIDKPDADACLLQDCSGATPLHAAIGNQVSLRVLETIFDPAPEASRVVDHHGLLPLHYVAAFCHTPIEFVKQLLDAHPDAIFARTADGDTPLHLAISNAKEEEEEDDDDNNDEEEVSKKDNNDPDTAKDTSTNDADGDAAVAGIKQHKTTLTIETIKLLLGNFSASDSRNPVFIKNHAELTPLQCCAEFDSPDNIKNVIVMHCVNHSPCQNWRERHSYAIDYARTANYTLPDNFDDEYKTNKKKEEEEASANAMAKKLLHGKKGTAKTTEPASVAFSEDLSSICFSEFLIDDDPSTVVEPPKHPERQSLRPQLEKLEEQLMNVALRSSTSKRDVTANNQSEDEQQQQQQNTNAEEDITASPTTRQQQQQQWPQTDKGDSTAEVTPSASKSNTSGRGTGGVGVGDDPKGTPDTANRTRQSSQEDNHDGGGADDDSARSSVSSITCTIFLKNAGNIGPSWAKGGFGAGVGGAGAGGGMMGGGGNGGGLLGTFHERPQSTADKMEALARVVPYAADASRGTHRMPLSLANSEQVKEMAAMLSLPIFCKKTHVPSSPNAGGKSSKSTRSRRSTGAGAMSTKSERRQPRKHSVDTEERTRQGKPNS